MSVNGRNSLETPPDLSHWSPHGRGRAGGPLTALQLRKLNQASIRHKRLSRAAKIATFNGTTIAIFAAVALVSGVFDTLSLVVGVVLAALAWNEFRGRNLLRSMDMSAPRALGWNQLGLMALVTGYALWKIYFALTGPSAYAAQIAAYPQIETMFALTRLEKTLTTSVYGSLIAVTVICQGGCAWYYFSRAKYLRAYVSDTEPWIVDIQRASRDG